MEFVQKFTPLDFQVKNFTPSILPNFNSFSKKKTQKMSENGEIYTAGKNFTLPPALTGWTNSTSGLITIKCFFAVEFFRSLLKPVSLHFFSVTIKFLDFSKTIIVCILGAR